METVDCYNGALLKQGRPITPIGTLPSRRNPATGPIFVVGAEPGDVLAVDIRGIELAPAGVITVFPGRGPLGNRVGEGIARCVEQVAGDAVFLGRFRLPRRAMIGVIGVAPEGEGADTQMPGCHGGNLDTSTIGEGSRVLLPVYVQGALLSLGDVHAAMGDGEVCGTGAETAARITLSVALTQDVIDGPVVETADAVVVLASGPTLDDAACLAVFRAVSLLGRRLSLALEEAYMLASLACDLEVSQIVNPLVTARMRIPAAVLRS